MESTNQPKPSPPKRCPVCGRELPPNAEDFTVQDVYAYLAALRERNISRAYQHRLHREVKTFFSWCKRLDIVQDNVFARVPIVKLEQQIIQHGAMVRPTAVPRAA